MTEALTAYGAEIFAAIAAPVVLYLATLARSYVKAAIARMGSVMDAEAKARLEAAFDSAIAAAEAAGKSVTLQDVIDYTQRFNPGDLARFNLSGNKLVDRVKAGLAMRGR